MAQMKKNCGNWIGICWFTLGSCFFRKISCFGYDNDAARVKKLNNGWDRIEQMTKADLVRLQV
jgi:hypothetical protein